MAKNQNGVKCQVVRHGLFDKTVDAKGIKTKNSKGTIRAFFTKSTKKSRREKSGQERNRIH